MIQTPAPPRMLLDLPDGLAPHPVIPGTYRSPEKKREFLDTIFDETASDYDRIESWLSFGSGRWYRGQALKRAGLQEGMRVADIATGTGLVAGEALTLIGPTGQLVGVDPSQEMMRYAHERLAIKTVTGIAESIPLPDASFDFLSMGYALRHVEDLNAAFREFHRVLTPEGQFGVGRLCILEITRPKTRIGRTLLRLYLGVLSRIIGMFVNLAPRTPELWSYYWQTIDKCIRPERVMDALHDAGFQNIKHHIVAGIFSEYTASRGCDLSCPASAHTDQ